MSNLLKTGVTRLAEIIKARAASTVTYIRGGYSVDLSATFGRTEYEQLDTDGFGIRMDTRDFIVTAADLVMNSVAITPQNGDTITETVGGVTRTHEVLGIGTGPCFAWSDPHRTMMRIHTKQLRIE